MAHALAVVSLNSWPKAVPSRKRCLSSFWVGNLPSTHGRHAFWISWTTLGVFGGNPKISKLWLPLTKRMVLVYFFRISWKVSQLKILCLLPSCWPQNGHLSVTPSAKLHTMSWVKFLPEAVVLRIHVSRGVLLWMDFTNMWGSKPVCTQSLRCWTACYTVESHCDSKTNWVNFLDVSLHGKSRPVVWCCKTKGFTNFQFASSIVRRNDATGPTREDPCSTINLLNMDSTSGKVFKTRFQNRTAWQMCLSWGSFKKLPNANHGEAPAVVKRTVCAMADRSCLHFVLGTYVIGAPKVAPAKADEFAICSWNDLGLLFTLIRLQTLVALSHLLSCLGFLHPLEYCTSQPKSEKLVTTGIWIPST